MEFYASPFQSREQSVGVIRQQKQRGSAVAMCLEIAGRLEDLDEPYQSARDIATWRLENHHSGSGRGHTNQGHQTQHL